MKKKRFFQENDDLRRREKEFRIQVEILESSQDELVKKNASLTKVREICNGNITLDAQLQVGQSVRNVDHFTITVGWKSIRQNCRIELVYGCYNPGAVGQERATPTKRSINCVLKWSSANAQIRSVKTHETCPRKYPPKFYCGLARK